MKRQNEMLIEVIERFLFHRNYQSDNPNIKELANKMADIEIAEMWMLTQ